MIKVTLWIIFLALVAYLILCALLYSKQRSMLYYPTPPSSSDEAQVVWLSHAGQSLKVWHISGSSNRALIYFGGNAEDVALNISQFRRLFPDHSVYLQNYRGYGGSSGKATESALFSDAIALYDHIRAKYEDIDVMGRSLGTAVAIYLAAEREISSLVLVTPYDSMVNLAGSYYPLVPVSLLMKDRFDSLHRVVSLENQTLVLIAEHDEVIPRRITDSLVSLLKPETTRVEVITGAGHNTIGSSPQYENALQTFILQRHSARK